MPDYPATGKRTLQDNGTWLKTLPPRRRRVGSHTDRADHPHAVVTADGVAHEADVIVYATGFRATEVLYR